MKRITLFFILMLCATFFAEAQEERLATGIRDARTAQVQNTQSRALTTIYETDHLGANGVEISSAANGPNTSMADAIVLAGTNRILQTVTVDVFNLTSAAPYDLNLRIYTDCSTNGPSGACGSGLGVLVSSSTVTVAPGPLGFIYSVVFTLPNVNLYPETDNNISVSLNSSRPDVYWILNESPVIGSQPAGEPANSIVQRCGSSLTNNGCARNFGLINNFSLKLEAEAAPPNDLCANAITITGDGTINGTTVFATPDSAPFCGTGNTSPGVWYMFTDTTGTGSTVDLNLCSGTSFDTKLSVFSGSCGTLTCVVGNDDSCGVQSAVNFTTDGSSTYYVLVHGFLSNNGPFELNVSGLPIVVIGDPPIIACPANITVNNTPGLCSSVVNFSGVAFDTEDGNISGDIIATPASGSSFAVGDTDVELSVTDSDGNTSTCNFTVTVVDNELPVAVCQNITVDLDPVTGNATVTPAEINNGSTDNCGIATYALDVSSFDCSMT
ncbi:HYR domain-containing protein, partial [Aequorivita lipolytica]